MIVRESKAKLLSAEVRDDGFLVVKARISREGVMDYYNESGLVKEFLPPSELEAVSKDFKNRPLTLNHDGGMVNKDNKDEIVNGLATDVWLENGWIYSELVIMNDDAIAKALSTHGQISVGYYCEMDNTPGTFIDVNGVQGKKNAEYKYESSQVGLRANHVSLVENARAGEECGILNSSDDNLTIQSVLNSSIKVVDQLGIKPIKTNMTKIEHGAYTYNLEGSDAENIKTAFNQLNDQVKTLTSEIDEINTLNTEKETTVKENNKLNADLEAQIVDLQAQLKDANEKLNATQALADTLFSNEDLANEAQSRLTAWDKASSVLPDVTRDYSLTVAQIKDLVWEQADSIKVNSATPATTDVVKEELIDNSETKVNSYEAARIAYMERRQNNN